MTAADLRALADLVDQIVAAGFVVALEIDQLTIRARPAPGEMGEPFADGTRFNDRTGWTEQRPGDRR